MISNQPDSLADKPYKGLTLNVIYTLNFLQEDDELQRRTFQCLDRAVGLAFVYKNHLFSQLILTSVVIYQSAIHHRDQTPSCEEINEPSNASDHCR